MENGVTEKKLAQGQRNCKRGSQVMHLELSDFDGYSLELYYAVDFLGGSAVQNLPANEGDSGLIPDLGRFHLPWSN